MSITARNSKRLMIYFIVFSNVRVIVLNENILLQLANPTKYFIS